MFEFVSFYSSCLKQFRELSRGAEQPYREDDPVALANTISAFISHIDQQRKLQIRDTSLLNGLWHRLDEQIYTDATEFIDLPDFPIVKRRQVVQGLHLKNRLFATYQKVFRCIRPYIHRVNEGEGRACKLVEIAGGEGYLSCYLYEQAERHGLCVDIHCTDIVEDYMQTNPGRRSANGSSLRFEQLDALNTDNIADNEYDLMLSLHSVHHFSPEQLGRIFNAAGRVCRQGILVVDAKRSIGSQLFIIVPAIFASLLCRNYAQVHDATISARKMYPVKLLHAIGALACPGHTIDSGPLSLGLNYLRISEIQS